MHFSFKQSYQQLDSRLNPLDSLRDLCANQLEECTLQLIYAISMMHEKDTLFGCPIFWLVVPVVWFLEL